MATPLAEPTMNNLEILERISRISMAKPVEDLRGKFIFISHNQNYGQSFLGKPVAKVRFCSGKNIDKKICYELMMVKYHPKNKILSTGRTFESL